MTLGEHLQSARESLFRFEYLQEFDTPEEKELFRTYIVNGKAEIRPMMKDWWGFLEAKHAEGVLTQRVRFVRIPQTKYVEWELYIHRQSLSHGDQIYILEESKLIPDIEKLGDFWLVDDVKALKMKYDSEGRYVEFEEVNVQPYMQAKGYLLDNYLQLP
jgi:hypothetical protein